MAGFSVDFHRWRGLSAERDRASIAVVIVAGVLTISVYRRSLIDRIRVLITRLNAVLKGCKE